MIVKRICCWLTTAAWVALLASRGINAADCNGNGIEDSLDLLPRDSGFLGPPRGYPAGGSPGHLIAADLDGDGKPDLVTANSDSGDVAILRNHGDGSFQDAASYPVGVVPGALVVADLDGDGKPDLATANVNSRDVSVLLNHGDGTFKSSASYPISIASLSWVYLITSDLNGDGKPDLVTAHNSLSVLINKGDGTFKAFVKYSVYAPRFPIAVDINGDDKPDLAMANGKDISVLINRGDGTFMEAVTYSAGAVSLIAADLDGDGKPDIPGAGGDAIWVFFNGGNGTFGAAARYNVRNIPQSLTDLIAADLDGDGKPDLAVQDSIRGVAISVLLNRGDGTFKDEMSYIGQGSPITSDLNGDGQLDLVTSNAGTLSLLLNGGDGTFTDAVTYSVGGDAWSLPVAADINGDRKPDLAIAVVNGNSLVGGVAVFLNQGDAIFEAPRIHLPGTPTGLLAAADLNGDGKTDLVAGGVLSDEKNQHGNMIVFMNRGSETFDEPYEVGFFDSLLAVDLDGDGKPDFAALNSGLLFVLLNNGDGTFQEGVSYPVGNAPSFLISADFNGDGKPDLATHVETDAGAAFSVFMNQGAGALQEAVIYPFGDKALFGAGPIAGDFDGDGKADVAAFLDGGIAVLLNKGDGAFKDAVSYPLGGFPLSLVAQDLDQDGRVDLAAMHYQFLDAENRTGSGILSVFLNQGEGSFKAAADYVADDPHPFEFGDIAHRPLIAADLNGDGKPDLATANSSLSSSVSILVNRGNGAFRDTATYAVGNHPYSLITADFNGDGKPDLATMDTNEVSVLINWGDATFADSLHFPFGSYNGGSLISIDLNGDGMPELIYSGLGLTVLRNHTKQPYSLDLNHDGTPDECETRFHRGDPNSSGTTDISDGIAIFGYLFLGNPATLTCLESADANNDGTIDISDGIYLLNWLFVGGPEPAAPGPTGAPCGFDPDPPSSPGDLRCEGYSSC